MPSTKPTRTSTQPAAADSTRLVIMASATSDESRRSLNTPVLHEQSSAPDREEHGIQARNLARLSKAGVTIALGTDGNVSWAHHLETEDMGHCGHDPAAGGARREPAREHHQHASNLICVSPRAAVDRAAIRPRAMGGASQ